jgi:hypothetical protein
LELLVDCVWNVMAHAQEPDFVFRRNRRVYLNRQRASVQSTTGSRGVRISGSNVGYTMFRGTDHLSSEVMWKVLATHSIRQFLPHFPSRALPCAITFQLDSTTCPRDGGTGWGPRKGVSPNAVLLNKLIILSRPVVNKCPSFMEPCSRESSIGPRSEFDGSSSRHRTFI